MKSRNVRISLPQTAVGGLSENWLFKEFGDFHWELIGQRFGMPIEELRDERGERVLPVFARIRVVASAPLAEFREGDTCVLEGRLCALDEYTLASRLVLRSAGRELTATLLTVFARSSPGSVLTPTAPTAVVVDPGDSPDEELHAFHRGFLEARKADRLDSCALFEHVYELNPYHDLNGAGLLYFASYPHINDHCERRYLHSGSPRAGFSGDWAMAASTILRDVVYLGNCGADDEVCYRLESYREDDQRVYADSVLQRESDGALLSRMTVVKVLAETVDQSSGDSATSAAEGMAAAELAGLMLPIMAQVLRVTGSPLAVDDDLRGLGLDSLTLSAFAAQATERLGVDVDASRLFQSFTVEDIARVVAEEPGAAPAPSPPRHVVRGPQSKAIEIAIVGMAGRFPGADDPDELWNLLAEGREAIGEVPSDRWAWRRPRPGRGPTVRRGGFLRDLRRFDHGFFRISPREAALLDPQQRIFLEVAWEAFENAGHDVSRLRGSRTGVFVGVCHNDYAAVLREHLSAAEPHESVAASASVIANRVSYTFGFCGGSVAVDTLCSSSLVAVGLAVRALRDGTCEQALVGGVNVICDPDRQDAYTRTGALSPDGVCRVFDVDANGYVRGEGACALVLKPLRKARMDGDRILAVVKSVAENHGGSAQSLTAPNPQAQADLLIDAYHAADVDPVTVGYLEAHGTGTPLGDPIEVAGIAAAFEQLHRDWGRQALDSAHLGIGSLKSSIGHLEAAAGIAGMIKVLLAMRHGELPATRNVHRINPKIRLQDTPLWIVADRTPWPRPIDLQGRPGPRRAGVSSFGLGGTNAHVVLEEYVEPASDLLLRRPQMALDNAGLVFPLSARTSDALGERARALLDFLEGASCPSLEAVAYTLQHGRQAMEERLVVVAGSLDELRARLRSALTADPAPTGVWTGRVGRGAPPQPVSAARHENPVEYLASAWVAGESVQWPEMSPQPRRVALPSYPFRRDQHWAVPDEPEEAMAFLTVEWIAADDEPAVSPEPGAYLVVVDDGSQSTAEAVLSGAGAACRAIAMSTAELDSARTLDEIHAAHGGLAQGERLAGLVDLSGWHKGPGDLMGAAAVHARILFFQQLLTRHRMPSLTCLRVTRGPATDGSAGLYRLLGGEFPTLRSRTLDVDIDHADTIALARIVAAELSAGDRETQVRRRAGRRERARLRPLGGVERRGVGPGLDALAQGTAVITGGTGEIALALARDLARRGVHRLVLIGRSPLPDRADWPAAAQDPRTAPEVVRRIEALLQIVAIGAQVEFFQHSLEDAVSLRTALEGVRRRYGPITGVFHAAGVMDDATSLLVRTDADLRRVLDPKIRGLESLWAALEDQPPRLLVLFSSLSAAVPALASSNCDYAVANAYLDDFASTHDSDTCTVRSLQWPAWHETGLGRGRAAASEALGFPALDPRNALQALDEACAARSGAVLLPCRIDPDRLEFGELLCAPEPRHPAEQAQPVTQARALAVPAAGDDVLAWLTGLFARTLKVAPNDLHQTALFGDLGVDSLLTAELVRALEYQLDVSVDPTMLQEHPTLEELAAELLARLPDRVRTAAAPEPVHGTVDSRPDDTVDKHIPTPPTMAAELPRSGQRRSSVGPVPVPIAIIGMACRFPGAVDHSAFWANLAAGRDSVTNVPTSRWDDDALYSPVGGPGRSLSRWGGFIDDAADFDPGYFGFDELTARHLDPLVRKTLEVAAECLLDAGYADVDLKRRPIGVYVGARTANYREYLRPLPREAIVGLAQNFIAAHVSHHFDLRGPSTVVDSACSSSLLAVHMACQGLALGDTEMALAGGADLLLDEDPYLLLSAGGALSPSGRCRTFDRDADGFVPGEGAGLILLKRLDQARRDGDRVLAVIESTAVNNDGRTMGYTTPSVQAQRQLVSTALDRAGIDPRTIGHVETHGTGTMIGDPIELQALTGAYRAYTDDCGFCGIGSVKTNIGHLQSAAGAAGLIKTVLCLQHQQLPPTLNLDTPNPRFAFAQSPFYPVTELHDLRGGPSLERAAVSAFGFGGTNAHVILRRSLPPHGPVRAPLPPPVYHRTRIWALPERIAVPERRSARLDLAFLPTV